MWGFFLSNYVSCGIMVNVVHNQFMHKNCLGYPCLSPEQIEMTMGQGIKAVDLDPKKVLAHKEYLQTEFQIDDSRKVKGSEEVFDFFAPPLQGGNITQHFESMAKELFKPWKKGLDSLIRRGPAEVPSMYVLQEGWTRYEPGEEPESVRYPDDPGLVIDFETFVKADRFAYPIIGTAVSPKAVYVWLHPALVDSTIEYKQCMVSVGDDDHKLLIMHNCAYDHCRIQERYTLKGNTKLAVLDTMSIQRVIAGFSDGHKWCLNARFDKDNPPPPYYRYGSRMSLVASYQYITGRRLDPGLKEIRNLFVDAENLDYIRQNIHQALDYAVNDVLLTHELFRQQWAKYRKHVPSWVPIIGHTQLANSIVPIEEDWYLWQRKCEGKYQDISLEITKKLGQLADRVYEEWKAGLIDEENDPWLKNLDWSLPASPTSPMAGIPKWYQERVKRQAPLDLSPRVELSHYLLRLRWLGQPLVIGRVFDEEGKAGKSWGIYKEDGSFEKMPHYKSPGANVGIVLSEKYLHHFDAGRLSSDDTDTKHIVELASQISYWVSKRGLVLSRPAEIVETYDHKPWMTMAPQVIPHNTQSHRSGENLFLTLAAHTGPKVAAEVKSKVKAPPGYKIVGFDRQSLSK